MGGGAACVGGVLAESIVLRGTRDDPGLGLVVLTGALVGAAVAGGLSMLAGMVSGGWPGLFKRLSPGLLGGLLGGAVGGLLGGGLVAWLRQKNVFYFGIGWMLLGLAIGAVDGVYEQSARRLRNGFIGGAIRGLVA